MEVQAGRDLTECRQSRRIFIKNRACDAATRRKIHN
jgi:hypothetical protein